MQKLNLYNRINLSMTHSRIMPLCFDRLLDRKSIGTVTVTELQQLHQQSRTEKEQDQCFNPKILNRIRTNNFSEVVNLYMDPKNDQFFANQRILHSFKGKFILEIEDEEFSQDFCQTFLSLINRIKENMCLVFLDIKSFGDIFEKQFADILSKKLKSGKKIFCINFCKALSIDDRPAYQIVKKMGYDNFTVYSSKLLDKTRAHHLTLEKINSQSNTESLIALINEDRFLEERQYLVNVLPHVKAVELRNGEIECENCGAFEYLIGSQIQLWMQEPAWSNCAGCACK